MGVLSLVWILVGYMTILEFGLGLAVTKMVAELHTSGNLGRLPSVFWSGFGGQLALGTLAGGTLYFMSSFLVSDALRIPAELVSEVTATLTICSLSMPFVFVSSSVMGVLHAAQRFDLATAVQLPMSTGQYLIPLAVSFFWPSLPAIMVSLFATRVVGLVATLALAFSCTHHSTSKSTFDG